MKRKKISEKVIERISIYNRYIKWLLKKEVSIVTSKKIGQKMDINPSQVRRDLSSFGQLGKNGKGYSVRRLSRTLEKILGLNRKWQVALIGAGNLGRALCAYPGFKRQGFDIVAIFDSDKKKIGKKCAGVEITDAKEMLKIIKKKEIKIGIIAVPFFVAQDIADKLVNSGVKAILNFAPYKILVKGNIKLKNIDLATELEGLSYFLSK